MTKDELMKLALALADAEERVRVWGMMNNSRDPARRLQEAASYKVALSVLDKAKSEYECAIAGLSATTLDQLMRSDGQDN